MKTKYHLEGMTGIMKINFEVVEMAELSTSVVQQLNPQSRKVLRIYINLESLYFTR